ncbi:hypothetical protein RclHR1_41630001 [Rhizophagus clarus]|uniref:Uncharacterized protein n=1 Tax=Rhizophagus clarus TaxID=94130 RepID=A0A2Z6RWK1_9GLOM|nr:hypothetical protein RclHR1_41630001 [Rhizophagus clarus]GES82719.1 hypothetical protein RCL_e17888_RclHR1_41630001 [Rhizophagus clarus]
MAIFCGVVLVGVDAHDVAIFCGVVLVSIDTRDVVIFCSIVLVSIDARNVAIFCGVVLVSIYARNVIIFCDVDKTVVLIGVGVEAIFRGGVDIVCGDGVDKPAIFGEEAFSFDGFLRAIIILKLFLFFIIIF